MGATDMSSSPVSLEQLQDLMPFDECISSNHAAFLKGRSLGENVLLSSELIRDYTKSTCQRSSMLKVDIRKAFDTVCWDFVMKVMEAQNFPPLFRTWVKECITSPRYSMSINGELVSFFRGKKGLRQGDGISPYLFIMVMEVLSKILEKAVEDGKIRHSLTGISSVMDDFKRISGLEMNPAKSEIFFGGYADIEASVLSDLSGFKLGTFPTRHLGLPLKPGLRLSLATLQPLIDKIIGKIRLIASQIYGLVNFWSAVFVLPKAFYAKIDSICVGFLWRNNTESARGSRVAWNDICKPKSEGGLGIRLLEDFETVFRLKRESGHQSATIRSMLQLRPVLKEYMYCNIGNGENAAFWFDNWTIIGPLLEFAGQGGPRAMRVKKEAKVIDATRQGSWFLPPARSDQHHMIQAEITTIQPPNASHGSDQFLWRKSDGTFGPVFSSKVTWEYLRYIPRNSFMALLALLRRMPTRDRLRRWGMDVPSVCVLCSTSSETHHHLFFECEYSSTLWQAFASQIWTNPPNDLHSAASWILQLSRQSNANVIRLIKHIFQASIYLLWKERNARIFTAVSTTPRIIHHALDRLLRDRLLSIKAAPPPAQSPLQFYLSIYRPP
ncbi:uncharacterized protein LOC106435299 [Brassica napus]|uniref:uncharacterized protein LOC106435299 n=1 Tax=Brassica napus TaxID=3708 RepID=UPI0006AA7C66|nr:uncharacterized protein LOC106435299 [Brassica napus]